MKINLQRLIFSLGISGVLVFYISQKIKVQYIPYLKEMEFKEKFYSIDSILNIQYIDIFFLLGGSLLLIFLPVLTNSKNKKAIIKLILFIVTVIFLIFFSVTMTYTLSFITIILIYLILSTIILFLLEWINYIQNFINNNEHTNTLKDL